MSFDVATISSSQAGAASGKTLTLNAREGRNRALLMIVLLRSPIDNPPVRFESWILVKSGPPTTE